MDVVVASVGALPPFSVTTNDPPVESPNHVSLSTLDDVKLPDAAVALPELELAVVTAARAASNPAFRLSMPVGKLPVFVAFSEEIIASTLDGIGAMVVLRLLMQRLGREVSIEYAIPKASLHQPQLFGQSQKVFLSNK